MNGSVHQSRIAQAETPPSIDRARLIQRSLRCFVFGLIGIVPFAGSILACVALRLHRGILVETGERWSVRRIWLMQAAGLALMIPAFALLGPLGWILVAGVVLLGQTALVWRQCRCGEGQEWNPARRHIYIGAAAAFAGIFLTFALPVLGCALIARSAW